MRIGSLFSGYGGLEMALEAEGCGPVVWQAENNPYAQGVLRRHWPAARLYGDVKEIDATAARVRVICGGFPCQDLSTAGRQAGLSAERSGLWWEFRRIVRTLRPELVFIENVYSAWRKWLPVVRRSLWRVGYASLPIRVLAAQVGAPHRRARCFLLAYAVRGELREQPGRRGGEDWPGSSVAAVDGSTRPTADVRGISEREPEPTGTRSRKATWGALVGGGDLHPPWVARDANRAWELQRPWSLADQWRWSRHADGWTFESPVPGVDDGTPDRLDRERLCGNGVVPQAAALAFRTLMSIAGQQ